MYLMRFPINLGFRVGWSWGRLNRKSKAEAARVSIISEIQQALRGLSAAELESIADWLQAEVEESRYRTFHVREARSEYISRKSRSS